MSHMSQIETIDINKLKANPRITAKHYMEALNISERTAYRKMWCDKFLTPNKEIRLKNFVFMYDIIPESLKHLYEKN